MSFTDDFIKNCSDRSKRILGLYDIDPMAFSDKYFNGQRLGDLSIDPNASVSGISPNNYLTELAKPYAKKYFFNKLFEHGSRIYDDFTLKHVYDGTIYIHDATKLQPYCFGVSATEIATLGRPYSLLVAEKPKRLESFMGQLTEFIMDCSQEFAGAIAVTDLVPWMAWFIEKGEYTDKKIENVFQSFVHVLNNSFRVGGDSPFTNISVNSKAVYYDIFDHYIWEDGKTVDSLWPTIKRVQKIIVDFMEKGRPDGLPYKFPILTANFKANKSEAEDEWFEYIARKNHKGFMNVNFAERFAMCCRLNLEFDFKQNSFGGGGVKVGSMRVANINLPRVAYRAKLKSGGKFDLNAYIQELRWTVERAKEYLMAYRGIFREMIDSGYLKFFKEPAKWFDESMFFATVGFCGIWDAAEILTPFEDDRLEVMYATIDTMVSMTKAMSNGIKFNVEEVPSESAAGKMAEFNWDFGEEKEYYSNQFVPLAVAMPMHRRIKIEADLQRTLTGGGMTFINIDSTLTEEQSLELHRYMMDANFQGQFCINYGYSHCPSCKTTVVGKTTEPCSCGRPYDFYTRVVGYLANIKDTAKSKATEIGDRINYEQQSESGQGEGNPPGINRPDEAWKECYCV